MQLTQRNFLAVTVLLHIPYKPAMNRIRFFPVQNGAFENQGHSNGRKTDPIRNLSNLGFIGDGVR